MKHKDTLEKFKSLITKREKGYLSEALVFTDEPRFYQFCCNKSENAIDEPISAATDIDNNTAKVKALGEYIERSCLDNPTSDFILSSFNDLSQRASDPVNFLNFRDEDFEFRKQEYEKKLRQTPISWIEGIELPNGESILVPAQLVFVKYPFIEPLIRPRISTGAAAHESFEKCLHYGILEAIERDSFMIKYLSKNKVFRIILDDELEDIEHYFRRYLLELSVFETTTDLNIPSFACIIIDKTGIGPAVSVGLKAGLKPREAILGAILESHQVRQWIRYSYVEDKKPEINEPLEIDSVKKRGYYWYPIERIKKLDFFIKEAENKKISEIFVPINSYQETIRHIKSNNIQIIYVDITSKDIKEAGFHVIKAILPQLHPLYLDERVPCLHSKRLKRVLNGKRINSVPHPVL